MNKRQKYALTLLFVLVLVALCVVDLLVFRVVLKPPKLGLDLKGGLNVILTAKSKKGAPVTSETMKQAQFVVEQRVNRLGVAEPNIERQGTRSILVQLPGVKDPSKVLDIIGKTALLEFRPVVSAQGEKIALGKTLMTGDVLESARVEYDEFNKPKVGLTFTSKGAKQFEKITGALVGKQLAIVLDGKVMSAPVVQTQISGGKAEITGKFTVEEVKNLVLVLQTGRLPVELEISENRTVGPTLGHDSLIQGLWAGVIGLILVALFMVIFYRAYGLVACLALTVFAVFLGALLAAVSATLTLPGIAGIIFMFGSAVDSTIIVLERTKEEIRGGKTLRTAMDTGYAHGFQTFLDADLVTFTTATVIFFVGIGPIKGFALTLMLGIVCDLFTSYFFTRSILGLFSQFDFPKNPALLGRGLKEVG